MTEHIGYTYDCSKGHEIASEHPINVCPMAWCDGVLRAFGDGAQAENQRLMTFRSPACTPHTVAKARV